MDTRLNRYQTLQFQIIALDNIIDELRKKIMQLEDTINRICAVVERSK